MVNKLKAHEMSGEFHGVWRDQGVVIDIEGLSVEEIRELEAQIHFPSTTNNVRLLKPISTKWAFAVIRVFTTVAITASNTDTTKITRFSTRGKVFGTNNIEVTL